MSSISIEGILSGLDSSAFVDAVIASRSRPILFLDAQLRAMRVASLGDAR